MIDRESLCRFLTSIGWKLGRNGKLYFYRPDGVRLRISVGKRRVRMDKMVQKPGAVKGWSTASLLTHATADEIHDLPGCRTRIGTLILEKDNVDGMGTKGQS